jgi:hypothetical protein
MREFTKSMLSFSLAMPLFVMQQMANWMTAPGSGMTRDKATESFDRVTQATEEQLGDALQETFKAGDKIQRAMVDMMLGTFMPRPSSQGGMMGMATDAWRPASNCFGQNAWGGFGSAMQDATGWGPMPAADQPAPANGGSAPVDDAAQAPLYGGPARGKGART